MNEMNVELTIQDNIALVKLNRPSKHLGSRKGTFIDFK